MKTNKQEKGQLENNQNEQQTRKRATSNRWQQKPGNPKTKQKNSWMRKPFPHSFLFCFAKCKSVALLHIYICFCLLCWVGSFDLCSRVSFSLTSLQVSMEPCARSSTPKACVTTTHVWTGAPASTRTPCKTTCATVAQDIEVSFASYVSCFFSWGLLLHDKKN